MKNKFNLTSVKKGLMENNPHYSGFRFIACLDSDTCIICAGFDNVLIRNLHDVEIIEKYGCLNEHCRCGFVPVLKGDEKGIDGISYKNWFNELSEEEKKDILGVCYEAYKKGKSLRDIALSFTDEMSEKYMQDKREREKQKKETPVKRKKRLTDEELKEFTDLLTKRVSEIWDIEAINNHVERIKTMTPKDQHELLDYERKNQNKGAKK